MKQKYAIALVLFLFVQSGWSQSENSWTKKANFAGLKREKAVAFSIGAFGYISCGLDTAEITHNDLWQYDPVLDSWTQKASLPASPRRNAIGIAIEDKGYVGTGFSLDETELGEKLKDFWEYDPSGNSWTEKAHFPGAGDTGIYQATAFTIGTKGFIACGKSGSNAYTNELWEYNPETDNWVQRTSFPGGDRYQLVSFVLENKAYVGLGTDNDVFRKDFYEYDPASNSWETMPDFPGTERAKASTFTIGVKGYVVFGTDGGLKDELWEYNYYTQSWVMRAAFPGGGRNNAIAFSIGDRGYAGIGKETSGKKQTFYEYTPAGPLSLAEDQRVPFNIYPNPITETARVQLPAHFQEGRYTLFNMQGKVVLSGPFYQNNFEISKTNLKAGNYYLILHSASGFIVGAKKIVVL